MTDPGAPGPDAEAKAEHAGLDYELSPALQAADYRASAAAQPPAPGESLFERASLAAGYIREHLLAGARPDAAIILGSGLGAFADGLDEAAALPYADVPGFPVSTVAGHKGRLVFGSVGGATVLCLQGRFHRYEGYDLREVTFPVRVLGLLGARVLLVTNAAGGISDQLEAGDLMLIDDHLNLMAESPLTGPNDDRFGPRFPDMTTCYPAALRDIVRSVAPEGTPLKSGVYAALKGPAYETPAEIRMLRVLGADAVGMSTVPEVTVARHMGLPVVGISGIANKAAGITQGHVLSHEEVVECMDQVATRFRALVEAAIPALVAATR